MVELFDVRLDLIAIHIQSLTHALTAVLRPSPLILIDLVFPWSTDVVPQEPHSARLCFSLSQR